MLLENILTIEKYIDFLPRDIRSYKVPFVKISFPYVQFGFKIIFSQSSIIHSIQIYFVTRDRLVLSQCHQLLMFYNIHDNTVSRYICTSPAIKSNGFAVPIARSRFPSITFLISCRSRANLRLAGGPFPLCLHLQHYDVTRKCRATCYRIPESGGRANVRFACEI